MALRGEEYVTLGLPNLWGHEQSSHVHKALKDFNTLSFLKPQVLI